MENELKVYVIQWHNRKNFDDKFFGEDFEQAKREFDECNSKDSFDTIVLIEVTYIGKKPIFNKDYLIEHLKGYYHLRLKEVDLFKKSISNNGYSPKLDTIDLANAIF
ncbi:hypothetical protein [Flavobacterium sp. J27]|uniref:hypothetical protein n=1 Tax=Flavobacterium sp. J27 TaxID=2060419 RepID=UPI0010312729|nr:hypothetical protein [Flavobacterium sp. J27]